MREKLDKVEGSLHLNKNATPLERFRYNLCQEILVYKQTHNMKQRELAHLLGVNESIISKILHHRIDQISTDKLIEYLQQLTPQLDLKVKVDDVA